MSIASTRKMICNKISKEFDTILQPLEAAKAGIKAQISSAKAKLSLMTFSPAAEISTAITSLESDVEAMVPNPNTEDIDEIIEFIKSCNFLEEHGILKNPVALLKGGVDSAIDEAFDFVTDLTELLPEFDAGQILGDIIGKFSGAGTGIPGALDITNILQMADKIINCIAGRCGTDFSDRIVAMTETLDELYEYLDIVSDPSSANWGKFDIEKIYNDVSLSVQEKIQMNSVVDSIKETQTTITESVENTVNAVKSRASSVDSIEGLF